ncbi:MAG: hypothetical protein LBI43_04890 [Streptococcaceae bacterium]|jgi:hypothetical protein|nr:hypothetical protein [Streptococcaceae bacterium]
MNYKVIVETKPQDSPQSHEMRAALILANYFECDVHFLRPESYKTPDLLIDGSTWEIKSPMGNSKKTMENNLRSAKKQSRNIIIDMSRCKMNFNRAISRINYYLNTENHQIQHLKIIEKSGKVIDIR